MFKTTELGKLLGPDDKRDAIHIAVAPMICDCPKLMPGQHVGLIDDAKAGPDAKHIGIVDPFLREPVLFGQRFWMFLYPNTITSLRHDWSHPAWETDVSRAKQWIKEYAERSNLTYAAMMAAAETWITYGDFTYENSESYKFSDYYTNIEEFWKHFKIITGKEPASKDDTFLTCSC